MKLTIDNALAVIRVMIEAHLQECSEFTGERYLADTDHPTIDSFIEEMKDTFLAEFEEG